MTDEPDEVEQDEPDEGDDEVEIDWLEALWRDGPRLRPDLEFTPQCSKQSVTLEKPEFENCLLGFIRGVDPSVSAIDPPFTELLFQRAVSDRKHMAAWDAGKEVAQSEKLRKSLAYVEQEIKRYKNIYKLLFTSGAEERPGWMFGWHDAWVGSYRDHTLQILHQLSTARKELDAFTRSSLGRTNFETHLVALAKPLIREAAKKASLKVELKVLIASYAHASGLISAPNDPDSGFIDAVNMRVSRAPKSKEIIEVLSAYLMHDV